MSSPRLRRKYVVFVTILFVAFFSSCENGLKRRVMPEDKMEDVLYDYHLVDGIVRTTGVDSATQRKYLAAVFTKHGISQTDFDSSMVYYMRRTDQLETIYKRLYSRIENEGRLQGVNGSDFTAVSTDANNDTANIWKLETAHVLSEHVPFNVLKFGFNADSTFRPGDKFIFSFDSNFISQEGPHSGFAMLTMILDNDSAITRTAQISTGMSHKLELDDNKRLGIKEIKGYVMNRPSNNASDRDGSRMKLLVLSKLALIKMHTPEPIKLNDIKNEENDSIIPKPAASV